MSFAFETPRSGVAALFALNLGQQLPTLTTGRLILRAPRATDFDTYAEIVCSARAAHIGGPKSREDAWDAFAAMTSDWRLDGPCLWTIGHAGGIAGFIVLSHAAGETELVVMLTSAAEGEGIAAEAACTARDHAFDVLGRRTLVSYIAPFNARARALATRLGATRCGYRDGAEIWRHAPGQVAAVGGARG